MLKKNLLFAVLCFMVTLPSFAQNIWIDAMKGNISKMETALNNGADVNAQKPNSGYTALFFAVAGKQYKAVEFLTGKGARPDIKNDDGETPLCYAITTDNEKMVKLLIDKGADVNIEGRDGFPILTALTRTKGDFSIIEMLYNAGADITVKDDTGHDYKQVMWLRKDKKKIETLFSNPPTEKSK